MVQLMPMPPKTPSSLASFKSILVLPIWYHLFQVVLEKRLLNMSSSSSSSSSLAAAAAAAAAIVVVVVFLLFVTRVMLCLHSTSQNSIKMAVRIELVFGMEASFELSYTVF